MGIEDIQISEELETNAPSIKYSGNEGPKSPQQIEQMIMKQQMNEMDQIQNQEAGDEQMIMEMAGGENNRVRELLLKEETVGLTEDEKEELRGLIRTISAGLPEGGVGDMAMKSGLIDEYRNYKMGQEEAGEQFMSPRDYYRSLEQDRIGAAYGGIMGMDGRRQYGLGSRLRKLIPNEVAKVAEVAAPFVAPFNPIAAGLMSGIGGFDRTGRIGSSLKSGLMNYGMGQLSRGLGGGMDNLQGMSLKVPGGGEGFRSYFSSPIQDTGGLGKYFKENFTDKLSTSGGSMVEGVDEVELQKIVDAAADKNLSTPELISKKAQETFIKNSQPKNLNFLQKALGYAKEHPFRTGFAGAAAISALMSMGPDETVSEIMDRGEGLDIESIRTEVQEAFADSSGDKLSALRVKYPYLGRADTKDFANGGRIGMAEGGIMDLGGMEKDYRAEGGFVPIGKAEKADDVPARLSVNEFVFTADAVRNAGGGDIDKGAEIMENMMKNLEAGGQVSEESQGMQGAQQMFETSQRLSEVM